VYCCVCGREEARRVDVLGFGGNSDVHSLDGVVDNDVCLGSDDEDGANAVAIVASVIVKADVCIVFIVKYFYVGEEVGM